MISDKKLIGTSIFTAVTASLCCITPVLALISGTGSVATTFSWVAPFRPYLVGLTILVLVFAWYQQLKPKPQYLDCNCDDDKPKFINSKKFLTLVSVFAILMLAFPYYSDMFHSNTNKEIGFVNQSNIEELNIGIKGMTCTSCETHIEGQVNKLTGIVNVKADYEKASATVKYNKSKVSINDIKNTIIKTGYTIDEGGGAVKEKNIMNKNDNISFYKVSLVCNAVPNIGCGSRSKPILLEFDNHKEIKSAELNKEGTVIKIVWEDNIDISSKKLVVKSVLENNAMDAKLLNSSEIVSTQWLNANDVNALSRVEAGIIATQLIESFTNKGELPQIQQDHLRQDIEAVFYDFFLNYKTLDQLADTNEYRKLLVEIIKLSESYIDKANIPTIESLLKSCHGHSEKCNNSSCCNTKTKS